MIIEEGGHAKEKNDVVVARRLSIAKCRIAPLRDQTLPSDPPTLPQKERISDDLTSARTETKSASDFMANQGYGNKKRKRVETDGRVAKPLSLCEKKKSE